MPQTFLVPAVPRCLTRPRRWPVALLVGLTLSLGMIIEGQAATTWTVGASGCDYSSIQAAIAASTTHNGDTLAVGAGTYTEAGMTVNKSLTLQGEDADTSIMQAATTPGTVTDRVFTIASGVTVPLQDLTIRYGKAAFYEPGGGLYCILAPGTLTASTVSGNTATSGGGFYGDRGTLTLTASVVAQNGDGGIAVFTPARSTPMATTWIAMAATSSLPPPIARGLIRGLALSRTTAGRPLPTPCSPAAPRSIPSPGAPLAAAPP
jgi:hypothetical protein